MAELTIRYFSEITGVETTIDEISEWPRWERVWYWWAAMEQFDGKPIIMSMDECRRIYGE